jgi:hypothetical protein
MKTRALTIVWRAMNWVKTIVDRNGQKGEEREIE